MIESVLNSENKAQGMTEDLLEDMTRVDDETKKDL
jgi:hypothetical protein